MNIYYHSLRREAQSQMDAYPQYDRAYWDEYILLVKVVRQITTMLGVAFERGDLVIAHSFEEDRPHHITAWSFRNRCATSLHLDDATYEGGNEVPS